MRRVLGLIAVIGLVAAISPATALAAKPISDSLSTSGIRCDDLSTAVGTASLYVEATEESGFASLAIWLPGSDPMEDLPDIMTDQATTTFVDSLLTAELQLVTVTEAPNPEDPPILEPAGRASIRAILTPSGDAADFSSPDQRDGNRIIRRGFFSQLMTVDGELSIELLDGTTDVVALDGCGAGTVLQTVFVTNPNAYILGGDQLVVSCEIATEAGSIQVLAVNDDFGLNFSQVVVVEGETVLVGLGIPELTSTSYLGSYELFDPATREVRGSASVDAALNATRERVNDREWVDGMRFSLVGEVLSVEGSLSYTTERGTTVVTMDDASCEATDLRVRVIERIDA